MAALRARALSDQAARFLFRGHAADNLDVAVPARPSFPAWCTMTVMINTSNRGPVCRGELARFIAQEIERVLLQHDEEMKAHTLVMTGGISGAVVVAIALLSPADQQAAACAIQHRLAGLTSEFVQSLVTELVRRGEEDGCDDVEGVRSAVAVPGAPGGADALDTMLIEDWAGRVVGSTYLGEKLRIPRSTLHRWQRRNEIVALRKGSRRHVFPLAQFIDGRPAAGICDVLSVISNPRMAWFWLNRPSPDLNGRVPIEMLRQDCVAEVMAAARNLPSA